MLRVGLTGGLGSGKSTVAAMLAERGAEVVSSDDLARAMMRLGEPMYRAIVERFGAEALRADGELDRPALARIAFGQGRVGELEAIVHPAVIARQEEMAAELEARRPGAVWVVESALLLQTRHGGEGGWQRRFSCVVVVTAPEELRVERYAARGDAGSAEGARAEARRRMAGQMPEAEMVARAEFVVPNAGSREALEASVDRLWAVLEAQARTSVGP